MKEQTKKILRGVFFYISWIVDSVRWFKKKREEKKESKKDSNQPIN